MAKHHRFRGTNRLYAKSAQETQPKGTERQTTQEQEYTSPADLQIATPTSERTPTPPIQQKAQGNEGDQKEQSKSKERLSKVPFRPAAPPNNNGLPNPIKSGVEELSGFSMDDVKVHYNSSKPKELGALAYTQGSNIHVAPGQEKHLPHEAWHVVQQMQGRVQPTIQTKGRPVNDDPTLEQEADQMGDKAQSLQPYTLPKDKRQNSKPIPQAPVVQRIVMTDKEWGKESGRVGLAQSAALLRIDGALMEYNKNADATPREKQEMLRAINVAIRDWRITKRDPKTEQVTSARKTAVDKLEERVKAEDTAINSKIESAKDPKTNSDVFIAAEEQFYRGRHRLNEFLSWKVSVDHQKEAQGYWQDYRSDAMALEHKATRGLGPAVDDPEKNDAILAAKALREAMRAFRTVSYHHLKIQRPTDDKTNLSEIEKRLNSYQAQLKSTDAASPARKIIELVMQDADAYAKLVGAVGKGEEQLKAGKEEPDFELLDEILEAVDNATTQFGFQGTGGKGNEGFNDYTHAPPGGDKPDERSDGKKAVHEAFSKLAPSSDGGKDAVSGTFDMLGGIGGLESDFIALMKAAQTIKETRDQNPLPPEFYSAHMHLAQVWASGVANVFKIIGGGMTALRGAGVDLPKSAFGFDPKIEEIDATTDYSTDSKMASDFFAAGKGIFDSIERIYDLFHFIKSGGGTSAKEQEATTRRDLEAVGNTINKYTATVATIAGTSKALIKLGCQIAGDGQNVSQAATGVTGVANLGGIVPGLNIVSSFMAISQNIYKLVRIGIRRSDITSKIDNLMEDPAKTDTTVIETLETVHESLVKRTVRLGVNLGHSLTQLVAGGFNLTGFGAAPGMIISLASTAGKIGQIGARKGKQWLRDHWAKKREKEGKKESFQDFRHRKRLAAAESGRKAQILTAIKLGLAVDWDKSSSSKAESTRSTALEILNMNDPDVFKALGVTANLGAETTMAKKIEVIEAALKKRD